MIETTEFSNRANWLRWCRRRGAWIAVASVLALLTIAIPRGWLPFLHIPYYAPSTMTTIPAGRTTHCIGRYLITLPIGFELLSGAWGDIELYYGLDENFQRVYATVKPGRYTNEAFWKEVNKRRFELTDKINSKTKGSMLLHEQQIDTVSALLRRLGDEHYGLSIKSEVHVLVGQRHVTLEQESYSKDESNITYENADPAPAEARLKMIASRLLPYENAERAKPGFCMQGVLFDVEQDDETALFYFRSKDMGDVFIDVDYHAVTGQPSKGVLERAHDMMVSNPLLLTKVVTLRERKARLGGDPAEESLLKTIAVPQHHFVVERRDDAPRTLDRPYFGLRLTTGKEYQVPVEVDQLPPPDTDNAYYVPQYKAMVHRQGPSSLSDNQVLKLWDEVVASVRKRR